MASIRDIYDLLFSGEKVTIAFSSWRAAENLRIGLQKHHRMLVSVDLTADSLCFSWDKKEMQGTYWLGSPRRVAATEFTIVSHEPVSETLAENPNLGNSDQSTVPSESPEDFDPSYPSVQGESQCTEEGSGSPSIWDVEGY